MAWILDERVRESVTFTSATTMRLSGAAANHVRFNQAKRRDGTAIQSGDRMAIGVVQSGIGAAVVVATFTSGAEDTLTLDNTAPKIYQSTSGAALPAFSPTGATGEAFITTAAPLLAQFDENGGLILPDLLRKAIIKNKLVSGFLAELGTVDLEGVAGLGVNSAFDDLAGLFAMNITDTTVADAVDNFQNENSATGRIKRLSMKPWPTIRPATPLADQGVLEMVNASVADRVWLVKAWAVGGAHRSAAIVTGHATDPQVDVLYELGSLPFDLLTTSLRIRNTSGGPLTVRNIRPVIG